MRSEIIYLDSPGHHVHFRFEVSEILVKSIYFLFTSVRVIVGRRGWRRRTRLCLLIQYQLIQSLKERCEQIYQLEVVLV